MRWTLGLLFVCVSCGRIETSHLSSQQPPEGELCTATDPNFDEFRYSEHIAHCKRNVTHGMKMQIAANYGNIPESEWPNYEFDHFLPLCIGGSSNIANLWPEPIAEAKEKDKVEQEVYNGMNNGTMTQEEAVQRIRNWQEKH